MQADSKSRAMNWSRARRSVGLGVALALAVLTGPALAEPCPKDAERSVRVDVTLDWEAETILVDPESVEIYLDPGPGRPNRVCWVVVGLREGQTLHLESKPGAEQPFPSLERDIGWPRDFANSGKPSHVGTWTYDVAVSDGDGEELMRIDPEVNVEEGP